MPKGVYLRTPRPPKICTVKDCLNKYEAKGLCHKHWMRERSKDPALRDRKNKVARIRAARPEVKASDKQRKSSSWYRFKTHCQNATRKHLVNEISYEHFLLLTSCRCKYCGLYSKDKTFVGLDRKDNSQGYTLTNTVPCCAECNYMKRNLNSEEFVEKCRRVIMYTEEKTTV